jgi:outer membrane protein assembly factor BamA
MKSASSALALAAACLLGAGRAWASEPIVPEGRFVPDQGEKIADVEIRCMEGVNLSDVRKLVSMGVGAVFSPDKVSRSIKLLYETGLFSDISVYARREQGALIMVLDLTPRLRVSGITVKGRGHLAELEILRVMRVERNDEFVPQDVPRMEADIGKLYERAGFRSARVAVKARQKQGTIRHALEVEIEEGRPTVISEVRFEGDAHFPPSLLMDEISLSPGDRLDMGAVEKKLDYMLEFYRKADFPFASVGRPKTAFSADGPAAVLTVPVDCGERTRIAFDVPKGFPAAGLRKALGKAQEEKTATGAGTLIERFREYLDSAGFPFGTVEAKRTRNPGGTGVLTFRVNPGRQVLVGAVEFKGNPGISAAGLMETVDAFTDNYRPSDTIFEPVPADDPDSGLLDRSQGYREEPDLAPAFSTDPSRVFVKDKFEKASQPPQDLYRASGFTEARVSKPELRFSDDKSRASITYNVSEGPRSLIRGIRFQGNTAFSSTYLSYQLKSLFSPYLSPYEVEEARLKIQKLYEEQGYAYVSVAEDLSFSRDRTDVDVIYRIDEGMQVKVGRVVLQGNDLTHDTVVRGNLAFKQGDTLKPSLIVKSQSNILKLQAIQGAGISLLDPDEMEAVKDVGVFVKERAAQSFSVSGGVSTEDGVRASVEYSHLNLGGRTLELGARLKLSYQVFAWVPGVMDKTVAQEFQDLPVWDSIAREGVVSLSMPRIYGLPFNMSSRLDLINERINERVYFQDRIAATPAVELQLAEPLTLLLSYTFEYDFIKMSKASVPLSSLTIAEQRRLSSPQGLLWLNSVQPTIVLDYRDDKFNPHKGFMIRVSTEYWRSLSTQKPSERIIVDPFDNSQFVSAQVADPVVNFIKLYGSFSFYIPTSKRTTLAFMIGGGNIFLLGDNAVTTADSMFYMGGRSTLRGFQESAMFPEDLEDYRKRTSTGSVALSPGGNTYILYKAEFRFPVAGGFEAGLFAEAGNLWIEPSNFNPFKLRPCAGFGIRYKTAVGPLALDVGFNLLPDNAAREPAAAFQFSVGLF